MSKMLKLLEFVGKSDTAKTIKSENNDAIKSMDVAIKAALPTAIKKRENRGRAQKRSGTVDELADFSRRRKSSHRRKPLSHSLLDRPSEQYDKYLVLQKQGLSHRVGKSRTIYTPPEIPRRRGVSVLADDPGFIAMRKEREKAQAEFERRMAEIKGPLQNKILAFFDKQSTHSMPDDAVIKHINKLYADQEREKKIDELTKKNQDKQKRAALHSWIQLRKAEKKIAEGKKANEARPYVRDLRTAVEKRNKERKEEQDRKKAEKEAARIAVEEAAKKAADDEAERQVVAMLANIPISIEDEPNARIQDILDTISVSGDHGLLDIKDMPNNGDCLFRAFAEYLNEYPKVFQIITEKYPGLTEHSGKSPEYIESLSFELRKIIVKLITSDAYWSEGEDGGYETRLKAEGRGFDTKEEYIKHMTLGSKARTTLESEGSKYIPRLNQGGEIEIQVFAEIVAGIKYIIIQANKKLGEIDHNNIRFMHGDEARLMEPRTLRLLRYQDTFDRPINKSGSHYDFLDLTAKGKEVETRMAELETLEGGKDEEEGAGFVSMSSAAPSVIRRHEPLKEGDCVIYTYPDGRVIRGISFADGRGIRGLAVNRDGEEQPFEGYAPEEAYERIKRWAITSKELEQFLHYPNRMKDKEERKLNDQVQRVNGKIDSMLNKYSTSAQASIKKHLTTIVELRVRVKSRLRTEGREDDQVKRMTLKQLEYKNLVKKYIKAKEPGKDDEVYDTQYKELLKIWQVRTDMRNAYLKVQVKFKKDSKFTKEIRQILEQCIRRKGGKRKRKTKRKRRKRKKKKSTRRKRKRRR